MKPQDLRKLQADELDARIRELRGSLFDLKVKHATGQLENTANMRATRRELARAVTLRGELEK
jgi:large subunit ribosomal protein L29